MLMQSKNSVGVTVSQPPIPDVQTVQMQVPGRYAMLI
jgi:hypothetical protein